MRGEKRTSVKEISKDKIKENILGLSLQAGGANPVKKKEREIKKW